MNLGLACRNFDAGVNDRSTCNQSEQEDAIRRSAHGEVEQPYRVELIRHPPRPVVENVIERHGVVHAEREVDVGPPV